MEVESDSSEGAAIRALGSLFKLTEVHLWDDFDLSPRNQRWWYKEQTNFFDGGDVDDARWSKFSSKAEDTEFSMLMNKLGLPQSFNTNRTKKKKKKNGMVKKEDSNAVLVDNHEITPKCTKNPTKVRETETAPSLTTVLQDISSSMSSYNSDSTVGAHENEFRIDQEERREDDAKTAAKVDKIDEEFLDQRLEIAETIDHFMKNGNGGILKLACKRVNDHFLNSTETILATYPQSLEVNDLAGTDDKGYDATGEWTSHWDPFYMRNYFYNIITQVSTWEPPKGMEHLALSEEDKLVELDIETLSPDMKHNVNLHMDVTDAAHIDNSLPTKKMAKKTRARRSTHKKEIQFQGILEEYSFAIARYWRQRYLLFSKFDEGIKMDEEGWFSVTPEAIAKHQAKRCSTGIIIDCFTGMGGNAIQFATSCNHVIAIDIDPNKINCAMHNASIYGVDKCINFIEGDCIVLGRRLKADIVFLSPPWGGPDYMKAKRYNLQTMLKPLNGSKLFDMAKRIAPKVVMFLPRNVDINQLACIASSSVPKWSLEVENNFLNGKLKAITAYFSRPPLFNLE